MPASDEEAIAILETLRAQGEADFLLLPRACLPWLELYPGLARHLARYAMLVDDPAVGRLYDLRA
jgi:hypothetical protein